MRMVWHHNKVVHDESRERFAQGPPGYFDLVAGLCEHDGIVLNVCKGVLRLMCP